MLGLWIFQAQRKKNTQTSTNKRKKTQRIRSRNNKDHIPHYTATNSIPFQINAIIFLFALVLPIELPCMGFFVLLSTALTEHNCWYIITVYNIYRFDSFIKLHTYYNNGTKRNSFNRIKKYKNTWRCIDGIGSSDKRAHNAPRHGRRKERSGKKGGVREWNRERENYTKNYEIKRWKQNKVDNLLFLSPSIAIVRYGERLSFSDCSFFLLHPVQVSLQNADNLWAWLFFNRDKSEISSLNWLIWWIISLIIIPFTYYISVFNAYD